MCPLGCTVTWGSGSWPSVSLESPEDISRTMSVCAGASLHSTCPGFFELNDTGLQDLFTLSKNIRFQLAMKSFIVCLVRTHSAACPSLAPWNIRHAVPSWMIPFWNFPFTLLKETLPLGVNLLMTEVRRMFSELSLWILELGSTPNYQGPLTPLPKGNIILAFPSYSWKPFISKLKWSHWILLPPAVLASPMANDVFH